VQGILFALLQRERTGEGQKISVSLYNSMLAMQMQEAAMIMMADSEVNWAAMPLSGVFETQTGPLVLVGAFKANPLLDICNALGLPDLSQDKRFDTHDGRMANKAVLHQMFRERFASDTRDHWLEKLEEQDLLSAPVRDMREALVDPQTLHNKMILDGGMAGGRPLRFIASPIQMSGATTGLRRKPPRLGEHTLEVLDEALALQAKAAA
jgi:crotonobetainyl-CoA:carnitine CoA-transferase CaiB-like acyl-CoA transferase